MNSSTFDIIFYIAILLIVITVHEFSHALTGHWLGDVTAKREGRLTLNPLAHIDPFLTLLMPLALILLHSPVVFGAAKPVPFNPYAVRYGKIGAALIAFAGPASNFVMAAFVAIYLRLFAITGLPGRFLTLFVLVNIAFFIFNMIPIPPLDGSRLVYAVAPPALADLMERFERLGLLGIFIFLLLLYPVIGPVIAQVVLGLARGLLGQSLI